MSFFFFLIVAAILGSIGAAIAGRRNNGCIVSIAVGFIGALVGRWLSRTLDLPDLFTLTIRNTEIPVVWTIAGSALFVAIINMIAGPARPKK